MMTRFSFFPARQQGTELSKWKGKHCSQLLLVHHLDEEEKGLVPSQDMPGWQVTSEVRRCDGDREDSAKLFDTSSLPHLWNGEEVGLP